MQTKSEKYDISIIIPAYNVGNYIYDCLQSVLQCESNSPGMTFDLIVINDGSTDNTETEILRFISETGAKLRYIITKNHGLSSARNKGLELAHGNYIAFLDSDDVWLEGMKDVLSQTKKNIFDIVEFNALRGSNFDTQSNSKSIYQNYFKTVKNKKCNKSEVFKSSQWFVWSRIFHHTLLKDVKFEVGRRYEDINFTATCYIKAQNILALNINAVGYRVNNNSITSNIRINDITDIWHAIEEQKKLAQTYNNQYRSEWLEYFKANAWLAGQALLHSTGAELNDILPKHKEIRLNIMSSNFYKNLPRIKRLRIKYDNLYIAMKILKHKLF